MHAATGSPRVSIVAFSPLYRDARVLRQIAYLSQRFSVTALGYSPPSNLVGTEVEVLSLPRKGGSRRRRAVRTFALLSLGRVSPRAYETWYWGKPENQAAYDLLRQSNPDIIHANDWDTLPLAMRVRTQTGACVVLDLHEYAPTQWDRWYWKALVGPAIDYFLAKYTPDVAASITVGEFIAERYADEYPLQPLVIMNAPSLKTLPDFRPTELDRVRLIHHGGAIRSRKLELMIETLAHTDPRYTLHLMLVGEDRQYMDTLRTLSHSIAPGRVFFMDPVPPSEIVACISEFDIGFFPLLPTSFSYLAALPNKFFDFVSAGLAVCTGPSPEMARLSRKHKFGVVAPSFDPLDIARVLNDLSAVQTDEMKRNACEARKTLNAETEMAKLLALYERILASEVTKGGAYA